MNPDTLRELEQQACQMRRTIINLCYTGGSLHLGGALSATEILIALWKYKLKYDPANPRMPGRDRFFLSKGHIGAALYIAQAMAGCYDLAEVLTTYNELDSRFGTHPCSTHVPSIEISSGSLGHGLPIAVGSAIISKKRGDSHRTYCLMGDGELNEGSIWEAAMAAGQYKLSNLVALVDRNLISNDGLTEDFMKLEPLADKWRAFGWDVMETQGNDMGEVVRTLDLLDERSSDNPVVILLNTVKGKGISFMENNALWHVATIDEELRQKALKELDERYDNKEAAV